MGPTSAERISFTTFHQVIHNGNPKQFAKDVVEHPTCKDWLSPSFDEAVTGKGL